MMHLNTLEKTRQDYTIGSVIRIYSSSKISAKW